MHKTLILITLSTGLLAGCNMPDTLKSDPDPTATVAQTSGEAVTVARIIPFAKDARIRAVVRTDCDLGNKLSGFVESYGEERGIPVSRSSSGSGKVLQMEITHVAGAGGGAWSGAKSVSVEGKLLKNGRLVGDFTATRTSGGGAFGGFKGTCSILGRCVKALGKDIAIWLDNPAKNSRIGE